MKFPQRLAAALFLWALLPGSSARLWAQGPAPVATVPAAAVTADPAALAALPPDQRAKVTALDQALAEQNAAVVAARVDLFHASFGETRDPADLRAKIETLKQAELARQPAQLVPDGGRGERRLPGPGAAGLPGGAGAARRCGRQHPQCGADGPIPPAGGV
jgi:hypothetical protein